MPEPGGHELLNDWRRLIESLAGAASSAAGRSQIPRELVRLSQRQVELLQEVIERERRLQGELATAASAPLDAVFDLLGEAGQTLRLQAEALESAGRALEETAGLMKRQAERFERTVAALRQPADLVKAAAGAGRRRRSEGAASAPAARAPSARAPSAQKAPGARKPPAKRKAPTRRKTGAGTKSHDAAKGRRGR